MTAFDHFQTATCLIAEGKRDEAVEHLDAAIGQLAGRRFRDEGLLVELRRLRRMVAR